MVPLEQVASGGEETVQLHRPAACSSCHGTGAKSGTEPRVCKACSGTGQKVRSRHEGGVSFQQISICSDCGGRGRFIDSPCAECDGRGEISHREKLKVKIPPGVEEGMALRVPGHGMPSPDAGGQPGDLFVVVHTAPDSRFERLGADLLQVRTIEVADAVLGSKLCVPTLNGRVEAMVPPGTQPDTVLRLRGKGLPEFGDGRRGDLLLRLQVRIPKRLSRRERQLYDGLRAVDRESGGDA